MQQQQQQQNRSSKLEEEPLACCCMLRSFGFLACKSHYLSRSRGPGRARGLVLRSASPECDWCAVIESGKTAKWWSWSEKKNPDPILIKYLLDATRHSGEGRGHTTSCRPSCAPNSARGTVCSHVSPRKSIQSVRLRRLVAT